MWQPVVNSANKKSDEFRWKTDWIHFQNRVKGSKKSQFDRNDQNITSCTGRQGYPNCIYLRKMRIIFEHMGPKNEEF